MPELAMGDACGLVRTRLSHLASHAYMLLYALSFTCRGRSFLTVVLVENRHPRSMPIDLLGASKCLIGASSPHCWCFPFNRVCMLELDGLAS